MIAETEVKPQGQEIPSEGGTAGGLAGDANSPLFPGVALYFADTSWADPNAAFSIARTCTGYPPT
ncbi:hypothetical protein CBM2599_B30169 [Cupriavidus taiwanensis]|nr:hypothetical protein CBM2599_B30169 [Cupriavidus taiwanensis]SPA40990.1 hypothetical protein CBM2606_A90450 [Cupriavidus taiwanensis]SPA41922.1 protein of unknown function [Cupriavidus taiwanensis]